MIVGVNKIKELKPDDPRKEFSQALFYKITTPEEWERSKEKAKELSNEFTGEHVKSFEKGENPESETMTVYHIKNYTGNIPRNSLAVQSMLKNTPKQNIHREVHRLPRSLNFFNIGFTKG